MTTLKQAGVALAFATLTACGSSAQGVGGKVTTGTHSDGGTGTHSDGGIHAGTQDAARLVPDAAAHDAARTDAGVPHGDAAACGACPPDYTCGTANGLPVCRAASGIPLFSHIFLVMEENTSLSTLMASLQNNAAPNFEELRANFATGSDYHGVAHPSLPNYIALTSGGTQGIGCDCAAQANQGTCSAVTCNLLLGSCTCSQSVTNLADQIEAVNKTWTAFGESMGTPCNVVNGTNYAVRHVPFLYYDDIQTDSARCNSHVVDYATFDVSSAPDFTYIAPNLTDDMHDPVPASQMNITDGDTWIGPVVAKIVASSAYKQGGLLVIVWDEDDGSGGVTGTNDPIPIFVISPYAKGGGYVSAATMDHYSLLATIDDGMGLPRLGNAGVPRPSTADTLADYFPAK